MRDLLLALVIGGLLPLAFKRPWVGALMFAWVSIMNPHLLTYGFANKFPWAQMIAIVTLTGFVFFGQERKAFPMTGLTFVYLAMIVWMSLTSLVALGVPDWVLGRWIFVIKIHVMVLITLMVIRERKQIELLVWVLVGSIAYYGIKGGLFTIATGGAGRVWGPPGGMIEENNALAVATIMMMPLMFFLYQITSHRVVRVGIGFSVVLMAFSVLGSQSRGALVALLAMAFLLGLKSKRPFGYSLLIALAVAMGVVFMPDSWINRMDTIRSYQSDSSAMSRIYTWMTIWNLAVDRPFIGSGFGTETLSVFRKYAPTMPPYDVFTGTVWVAHSIYFQALGEHGFVGLLLYLMLGFLTWRQATRTAKLAQTDAALKDWVPLLMRMCQVSLAGFCGGGAFLSLMHLDIPYYIMAIIVVTSALVRHSVESITRQKTSSAASISMAPMAEQSYGHGAAVPALRK